MTDFAAGDIVRVKASGLTGELEDINPRPLEEIDLADETWAYVQGEYSGEEIDGPDDIELVMSAAEADARELPTKKEIANFVSSSLHGGWGEPVDINESEIDGDFVYAYGTASNGLSVSIKLLVVSVERTLR
jgi:hypothetical protein